jgi:hypothetical protein
MEIKTSEKARTGNNFFIKPGLNNIYLPENYYKYNNTQMNDKGFHKKSTGVTN